MESQSPAIVTLTLYDVLKSIKQFTQAVLTMRMTIQVYCAADYPSRVIPVQSALVPLP
jgi:hypothetical protein